MNIVGDFHRNECISYKISNMYIYVCVCVYINYLIVRGGFELDPLKEELMSLSYKTLGYKSLSMLIDKYGFLCRRCQYLYTLRAVTKTLDNLPSLI